MRSSTSIDSSNSVTPQPDQPPSSTSPQESHLSLCKLSVRLQGGPKTGRTRRQHGAHPPLPLALPLRAGRQPVGQARRTRNPRAAETSDGLPRDSAHSGVDGCARRVGASGGGLWLQDGPESRSVWWVTGVEACPSRPPTSQDKPSRAAGGGEGRSVMECSTITTAGGPAPRGGGTTANGMARRCLY
jgi:hypothetical protein